MSEDTVDIRQLTPQNLDLAIDKWVEQDKLVDPSHPRFREYLDLSTNAKAAYQSIKLNLSMPKGLENIDATITKLNEMYETALKIRGEMVTAAARKDLGVGDKESFEGAMDKRVKAAFVGIDDARRSAIENKLLPMLYGLGVNPAELREGAVSENFYFFPNSGAVNFEKVYAAKDMVKELRAAGAVSPGLLSIADMLETGVKRMEAIEPGRAEAYAQYRENRDARKMDTKPLRIIGALGAGIISVFGLTQYAVQKVRGKNPEFSFLNVGWVVATMALVNPKILLQSGSGKALEQIANLGQPLMRKVFAGGFTDPEALAELQELRSDQSKLIADLSRQEKLTVAQIEGLTGSSDSPLTKTLAAMSESMRPKALQQLGTRSMDEGEIELTQTFMKTPGAAV